MRDTEGAASTGALPMKRRRRNASLRYARKGAIGLVGGAVTVLGVVLMALPGPGIAVMLLGLAILSVEFRSAQRAQRYVREQARRALIRARRRTALRRERNARRRRTRVDAPG